MPSEFDHLALVVCAALITLVVIVRSYRMLNRLENGADLALRIDEEVVRYENHLIKRGHSDLAAKLRTRRADLRVTHMSGVEEVRAWMSDPQQSLIRSWWRRWRTLMDIPKADIAFSLGVTIFVLSCWWATGLIDLYGVLAVGYIGAIVGSHLPWMYYRRYDYARIEPYLFVLVQLNIPLVFEREETTEAPPPSDGPRATDDTGMCWTIPRAD